MDEQALPECYIARRGSSYRACTKGDVIKGLLTLQMIERDVERGELTQEAAMNRVRALEKEGYPIDCAFAEEEPFEQCRKYAETIRREVHQKSLESLGRLKDTLSGKQPISYTFNSINGLQGSLEQAIQVAQTLERLQADVASKKMSAAQFEQIAKTYRAFGYKFITASSLLQEIIAEAQKAVEAIKTEITGKALALPGIDAVIMASVEGMSRSDAMSPLAQEVVGGVFQGDKEKFLRRAEYFTKKCLRTNEGHHICFSRDQDNGAATRLASASPEVQAAFFKQVEENARLMPGAW
jgi:hypothetical protein